MLTKEQAALLILKYIDSINVEIHRKYRKELSKNYNDVFKHFPNTQNVKLYRVYSFKSSDSNTFYKKLLDSLQGKLSIPYVSS